MSTPLTYSILVLFLVGIIMVGFVLFEGRHARAIQRDRTRAEPQPGRDSTASPRRGGPDRS